MRVMGKIFLVLALSLVLTSPQAVQAPLASAHGIASIDDALSTALEANTPLPDTPFTTTEALAIAIDDPFYPSHSAIAAQLQDLESSFPDIVAFHAIGTETHGTRQIAAIKISDNVAQSEDEPTWVLNGAVHGSEQLGVQVMLQLAEDLTSGYGVESDVTDWVDAYEIWIVVRLNIWGYDHNGSGGDSVTGTRKNGASTNDANTSGVDLARNYDFRWAQAPMNTTTPSNSRFRGPSAFSESETMAIRNLYLSERPIFGLTFHQGNDPDGGQVMRPWSTGDVSAPPDAVRLLSVANDFADWVMDSRLAGPLCDGTLEDPNGGGSCTNEGDQEFCTELCWEPTQSTLGSYGQPSNWYYHEIGTFEYTIEISDRLFNGSFMHSNSGPSNDDETTIKAIATEFAVNNADAVKSWFADFLNNDAEPYTFSGPGITGHVTHGTFGTPLEAKVEVSGFTSSLIEDRTSDAEFGRFWRLLPTGNHQVTVEKIGYDSWTQNINVTNGALVDLDVQLEPNFDIILPTALHPAWVGDPSTPRTFVLRMRIGGVGSPCVSPLPFQISVRDETDTLVPASVGAQACVQDTYFISVLAPDNNAGDFQEGNSYDVRVELADSSAEEANAIRYVDREEDTLLVLDVSGSMGNGGKIEAAQQAASLLALELAENDQGALVSFSGDTNEPNEDATLDRELAEMDVANQVSLISAIDQLQAAGNTSIGDGIHAALNELESDRADPDHFCAMVVLSDGQENEERLWDEVQDRAADSPCIIHTIALGPSADEVLMESISRKDTPDINDDGSYHYATTTDGTVMAAGAHMVADWSNHLAATYDTIAADIDQRGRFFRAFDALGDGSTFYSLTIDDSMQEVVFALKWSVPEGVAKMNIFELGSQPITDADPRVSHRVSEFSEVYRIVKPKPGTWRIRIDKLKPGPNPTLPFALLGSTKSSVELHTWTSAEIEPIQQGEEVRIMGLLTDNAKPIAGADLNVVVTNPGGQQHTLVLYDDGLHEDGAANDGFYANVYGHTFFGDQIDPKEKEGEESSIAGSYRYEATALFDSIQRFSEGSFAATRSTDKDEDGLFDPWEVAHGLDPEKADDSKSDDDMDGLSALEEQRLGTDPNKSDTDGGGENDRSELLNGRDPLWAEDDLIDPVTDLQAEQIPGAIRLTWTTTRTHVVYQIWARLLEPKVGPWEQLDELKAPVARYDAADLKFDNLYEFKVVAIGRDGIQSANPDPVQATPVKDPIPPRGSIGLMGNPTVVTRHGISLTLAYDEDAVEMRVGSRINEGTDTLGTPWQPVAKELPWTISTEAPAGEDWTVYVQFRDAAGNESEIFSQSVMFEPEEDDKEPLGEPDELPMKLYLPFTVTS